MLRFITLLVVVMFILVLSPPSFGDQNSNSAMIGVNMNLAADCVGPPESLNGNFNLTAEPIATSNANMAQDDQTIGTNQAGSTAKNSMDLMIAVARERTISDLMAQNLELRSRAAPDSIAVHSIEYFQLS
ncbi:MAG: hypothetical protein WC659_03360 [Patescibacteria group bacterium]